jgi:DeoR family transcriptional regulator, fructose operon transcriptional repressor
MIATERRDKLLELIRAKGFATLPDLAASLVVSESTIRRDVEQLELDGLARRTHGGVFYAGSSPKLQHFDRNQSKNWVKKQQIAKAAVGLLEEGDTVVLDGGSTTYELAKLLTQKSLQVITNSFPVANLFMGSDQVDLVMVGGYVHMRTGVSLGPYANEMLCELNCQRAILSVAAIHQDGFFNSNLLLVETERAMMGCADQVIVLADSTKFGKKSLSRLCALSDVQAIVVDDGLTDEWRAKIEAEGVRLIIAPSLPEAPSETSDADFAQANATENTSR